MPLRIFFEQSRWYNKNSIHMKGSVFMNISLKEAAARLLEAERLVITAHYNPDGDALGSSLALYQMLVRLGKDVRILIN